MVDYGRIPNLIIDPPFRTCEVKWRRRSSERAPLGLPRSEVVVGHDVDEISVSHQVYQVET